MPRCLRTTQFTLLPLLVLSVLLPSLAAPPTQPIWGTDGESWNRDLLLDWSFSGYANKERPSYPEPRFAANVLDFGALGDGKTDSSDAFRAAIGQVSDTGGGTILIPRGKYLITKRLVIKSNNVVLKGEGNETVLYFPESLSDVDGVDVEKHIAGGYLQSPYSWKDGFVQIAGLDPGSDTGHEQSSTGWVVRDSKMGERHLILDSTEGLAPGQWVRIMQSDTSGSLASYLYGTDYAKMSKLLSAEEDCEPTCASDISDQDDLVRWATRILSIEEGNVVVLQRSLPTDVSPGWKARLMPIPASMPKENGIRDLAIEFPLKKASRHHYDVGYNGILVSGAVNAFVLNVSVLNADQGILVRDSQMVSVDGIKISTSGTRSWSKMPWQGHIGVGLYDSADVEVADFDIRGEYLHDISVRGGLMCVFHHGRGDNLRLDTHRSAPYGILFSDIYLGKGTRPFGTGGYLSRGMPVAKFAPYYNLRNSKQKPIPMPDATMAGSCSWGRLVNFIGHWTGSRCPGYHVERATTKSGHPRDLYASMVQRKGTMRSKYPNGVVPQLAAKSSDGAPLRAGGDGNYPVRICIVPPHPTRTRPTNALTPIPSSGDSIDGFLQMINQSIDKSMYQSTSSWAARPLVCLCSTSRMNVPTALHPSLTNLTSSSNVSNEIRLSDCNRTSRSSDGCRPTTTSGPPPESSI